MYFTFARLCNDPQRGVALGLRLAMLMDAAALNVDHPIFLDARARVEPGFGAEVVVERRIADFDDQYDVAGARVSAQLTGRAVEDGDVGLWLAGWIVFGRNVDAARGENAVRGEDAHQPRGDTLRHHRVRQVRSHFADDLSLYEFPAPGKQAHAFELPAVLACPHHGLAGAQGGGRFHGGWHAFILARPEARRGVRDGFGECDPMPAAAERNCC